MTNIFKIFLNIVRYFFETLSCRTKPTYEELYDNKIPDFENNQPMYRD
jgi:hypothetical protein